MLAFFLYAGALFTRRQRNGGLLYGFDILYCIMFITAFIRQVTNKQNVCFRGYSNSAHAGLGGGGVVKMRANACMGEGGSRSCVRAQILFLNRYQCLYHYPFSEAMHGISM